MTDPTDVLLTVRQYAELKQVHPQTVRKWLRLGIVKAEKTREPKGRWRIKRPRAA